MACIILSFFFFHSTDLLGVRILRRRRRLGHIPPISSQQEHTDGGGNTRAEDSRWEAGPTGRSYCPALQRWLLQQPPLASQQTQSLLRGRACTAAEAAAAGTVMKAGQGGAGVGAVGKTAAPAARLQLPRVRGAGGGGNEGGGAIVCKGVGRGTTAAFGSGWHDGGGKLSIGAIIGILQHALGR
eukprot:CAMPEP_0202347904 /NCGR_PEP_ID=MMETSP1126-20121109/6070_1 /ASSEMBLY_ACC=CAM_ASM_000457 /TAXON_ID=3047 /ORGANISM="Dunaliella tertiolecta, Strain CCMP1320" /LENGTH=183 /DNA_ID=CAMNT_0048939529 /DNA_START=1125 /DNA_END=1677 /DNA_ORIENTATION=+